ncbi:hypothetical protein SAMN05443549_10937 [Flavobacterium fluvii]|uniref:Uncharacterized protein n=1 Tax=Flavobacterium fluvii TaxID=468056 RepID=A0A1M5P1T4_9FLAO|nr:hypothetical protein [Flavobacterium fluvii]SHG95760.1 hypothetical protein SAMN05443549_10937 [Flavobacterium fluvii]
MRTRQTFLVFAFMLLSVTSVSAQYGGNGYGGNGYGGNGYGGNGYGGGMNQMGSAMNQQSQPEKPKEIPADVTAAKITADMKPALNLDELQVIAITNVLIESLNTQGRILKQDSTQDEQMKDFQALSESTDRKINQFLNKEQKEKYLVFKEDRKNQKKSKDKSKSKTKEKPKEKENQE